MAAPDGGGKFSVKFIVVNSRGYDLDFFEILASHLHLKWVSLILPFART